MIKFADMIKSFINRISYMFIKILIFNVNIYCTFNRRVNI